MSRALAAFLVLAVAHAAPALAQNGTVSGTVTRAANGTPVANVYLNLCTASYDCEDATTDALGAYTITAAPGTYYLYTSNFAGLIDEIYNNLQCPGNCTVWLAQANGTPLVVTSGGSLSGRNFALDTGGVISGIVVNAATSAPVQGVSVIAYSFQGTSENYAGSETTNAAGVYNLPGLASGSYHLYTENSLGFVNEIFNDVHCLGQCSGSDVQKMGTPIPVTAGVTTGNRNFALESGGSISGTVRNSATLSPIAGITVYIVLPTPGGGLHTAASVQSNASGQYVASGLPSGPYYAITYNAKGYINEIYPNTPCVSYCSDVNGGTPIVVTAGVTTSGRDFDLGVGGGITGLVTRSGSSAPLSNVYVSAYWQPPTGHPRYAGSGYSDTSGKYYIWGLSTGTYYLWTTNEAGYVNEFFDNIQCLGECQFSTTLVGVGTPVSVTAGATSSGKNFALDLGGRISGTITSSADGTPLAETPVYAYAKDPSGSATYAGTGWTDATGTYEIDGLPTGAYYALTDGFTHQNEIYNNVPCLGSCYANTAVTAGHSISVSAGGSTTGINFVLDRGGAISGTVRNSANAAGLADVYVAAYRNVGEGYLHYVGYGQSNASGAYTITGLPYGLYYLLTSNNGGFQNQIYPSINCTPGCSTEVAAAHGTPVFVSTGATNAGRDFALSPATGRIAGTIINSATSAPADDVRVSLYARSGTGYVSVGSDYTSTNGTYEITDLPSGTYYAVTYSFGAYVDQIFAGIPCITACDYGVGAVSSGSPIAVGTGTITLNFALQPQPAVQLPGQPQDLSAVISAGTVAFTWYEPYEFGTPTDYVLQIGLAAGTTLVSIPVAATTYTASGVPPGRYFARVRGRNGAGVGPPSSEYEIIVNADGSGAPGAPSTLVVFHDGSNLEMSWAGRHSGGVTTGYLLEIGTATGLSNIATIPVGPRSVFTYSAPIPPGAYFVRVRARNALSVGPPSHEVMFVSGSGPAPPDPPGLPGFAIDASRRVLLGWLPPRGPVTNYLVEVGSALYKSDIGVFPIAGSATSVPIAGVPPGIYYVRMRSVNAQGASVPSYDMTVIVP